MCGIPLENLLWLVSTGSCFLLMGALEWHDFTYGKIRMKSLLYSDHFVRWLEVNSPISFRFLDPIIVESMWIINFIIISIIIEWFKRRHALICLNKMALLSERIVTVLKWLKLFYLEFTFLNSKFLEIFTYNWYSKR